MKSKSLVTLIGIVLMAFGGGRLSTVLGLTGSHSVDIALLAVGILLAAAGPLVALSARVASLEAQLAQSTHGAIKS